MTELYQAYGEINDNYNSFDNKKEKKRMEYEPDDDEIQVQQVPKVQQPVVIPQQPKVETFQNKQQYYQDVNTQNYAPVQQYKRTPSYSFWDRMALKRTEVIKLAIFSLVIVLAIAIDRMGTHYLSKYLSDNVFTDFQEFMLRLMYPIVIFITLWIIKSL